MLVVMVMVVVVEERKERLCQAGPRGTRDGRAILLRIVSHNDVV